MIAWRDVRQEPFRLLFPLGAVFGMLGVGHWVAYAAGWSPSYSGFYHASIQTGLFASCFIAGFLLTALPRFTSTASATTGELLAITALFLLQAGLYSLGRWVAAEACFAVMLAALAVFALRRAAQRRSGVGPPPEFVWIPLAILQGVLGTGFVMAGQLGIAPAWTLAIGRPMAQQGFVLGIVTGVGGFLVPRLMGLAPAPSLTTTLTAAQTLRLRRRRMAAHAGAAALFFASFWLEGYGAIRAAYLLRAAVVTAEFARARVLLRPPVVPDLYVRLVWAAMWLIIGGLWGAGVWPRFRVAMLHLVFLGGVSLLIFSVGTMVVLSHAGEGRRLREPLPILRFLGAATAASVGLRLAAEAWPALFFPFVGAAAACWIAAIGTWLVFLAPRVTRSLPPGEFEQAHEAAKARLRGGVRSTDAP